jgi:hypothetical protein
MRIPPRRGCEATLSIVMDSIHTSAMVKSRTNQSHPPGAADEKRSLSRREERRFLYSASDEIERQANHDPPDYPTGADKRPAR